MIGPKKLSTSRARERRDKELDDLPCPVCKLKPAARYFDEAKQVWIYKHTRIKGGIRSSIYHEAKK